MTELEQFLSTLEDKSKATKVNYKSQYNKLRKAVGDVDIATIDTAGIIKAIKDNDNPNQQAGGVNIGILIYKMNDMDTSLLEKEREVNKKRIKELVKSKNAVLTLNLPRYNELITHLDSLYVREEWTDYIINYVLINFTVRNKDLNFKIVSRRKDTERDGNYMWFDRLKKRVVYIRKDYKTANKYGEKTINITNPNFINAIKKVMALQKHNESSGVFIPNIDQLGYYIQKATYNQIGEGNVMKIVVNHFRTDLDKIKEISENRGTDINTILANYDIVNQ